MIRIFTLFVLFSISPISSGNDTKNNLNKNVLAENAASRNDALVANILKNRQDDDRIPGQDIMELAISGYFKLLDDGVINNRSPLSIVDFSLPSSTERLWVIDPQNGKLLHHTHVSHGRNSGNLMAEKFSNIDSSFMSSIGFYVTGETYQGKHGYSLRLDGVEKGFNDRARERAIVIHGAEYVHEDFVKATGRLGRSLGCPALPMDLHEEIIDTIKDKSCLFIYGKDQTYLEKSHLINT